MSITKIQVTDKKMVSFAKVYFLVSVSLLKQFQKYLSCWRLYQYKTTFLYFFKLIYM